MRRAAGVPAAAVAAAQVALELPGDRVAGGLVHLGPVDLVVALLEVADVLDDLFVLGGHLVDQLLPLGRLLGQLRERDGMSSTSSTPCSSASVAFGFGGCDT